MVLRHYICGVEISCKCVSGPLTSFQTKMCDFRYLPLGFQIKISWSLKTEEKNTPFAAVPSLVDSVFDHVWQVILVFKEISVGFLVSREVQKCPCLEFSGELNSSGSKKIFKMWPRGFQHNLLLFAVAYFHILLLIWIITSSSGVTNYNSTQSCTGNWPVCDEP